MMSLGLGQYSVSLYHLSNHAIFKALLFMAAGAVIHSMLDEQDLRAYGGLVGVLPLCYSAMIVGSLSLIAVPYLSGWYSKDGVLEIAVGAYTLPGGVVYTVGTIVAGLTAYYSLRLVFIAFTSAPRSNYRAYAQVHESSWQVVVPLIVLSVIAVGLGYVTSDLFRGLGTDLLATGGPLPAVAVYSVDAEFGNITVYKLAPLIATVIGSGVSYYAYITDSGAAFLGRLSDYSVASSCYRFFNAQWNFDALITAGGILPGIGLGYQLSKVLDRGILEALGPYGLQHGFLSVGSDLGAYNSGILTDYATFIVLGMLVGLVCFIVPALGLLAGQNDAAVASLIMALIVNAVSAYMVLKTSVGPVKIG